MARASRKLTLRITGGVHRGRRLRMPRGADLRPTADKVRSAVFSILGTQALREAQVLDLYAGSGALGLEALSRGAKCALFIEADARRCRAIREALATLALTARGSVRNGRVERILDALAGKYGLVFADPPYAQTDWQPLMRRLNRNGLLTDGAMVVAEHRRGTELADEYGALALLTRRRYGDTAISIYRLTRAANADAERIDG